MAESESSETFRKAQENAMRWRASNSEELSGAGKLTECQRLEEEKMCDITQEVAHLNEIKDIRDELKMIKRVLMDQQTVIAQYHANQAPDRKEDTNPKTLDDNERYKLKTLEQNVEFRISKIDRLSDDAKSVQDSVSSI